MCPLTSLMRFALMACVCGFSLISFGQSEQPRKRFVFGYPFAFYTPETSFGGGIAAVAGYRVDTTDVTTPISQIQLGAAYTINRQFILSAPFQYYSKGRMHSLYGEFTYNRFVYYFFGTGAEQPTSTRERYETIFPRVRLHYLRRFSQNWFGGIRYWYEHQRLLTAEEGGLLATQSVPGAAGGAAAGPGIVALFDSRDNIYSSRSGTFAEFSFHHQSNLTASNYFYDRWRIDVRHFIPLTEKQTFAGMAMLEQITGTPPFFGMAALGSEKRLRGYYDGYFRGKSLALLQTEWRMMWTRRFGCAAFFSAAWMGGHPSHLGWSRTLWSGGAGLRFRIEPDSRVTLRLDYAAGAHANAFYFTVGEAF